VASQRLVVGLGVGLEQAGAGYNRRARRRRIPGRAAGAGCRRGGRGAAPAREGGDAMADAAERAVTAYFDSAAQAEQAAQDLMRWDQANDDIKLGALGVLTKSAEGKVETKNYSSRNTGKGAKIGLGLGALAAVFSGGLTLIPTAIAGAAGGGLVGSLSKKGLGLSDDDLQQLSAQLDGGHAALLVLCDEPEVEATAAQLAASGGTVRRPAAAVSPEALQEAAQAAGTASEAPPATDAPGAGDAGPAGAPGASTSG
jgi:uncharacterized membrane protein